MILATIDDGQVMMNLKALQQGLDGMVDKAAMDVGFEILRLSQIEVPHDEGTLQNSGVVEEVAGDVVISYHAPYAARLHEHPEYTFQKGRKGKYLEDPVRENLDVFKKKFMITISEELSRKIK